MSEAAETLDGWYSLHLFYAVDWIIECQLFDL
jgi:peroxiredoxin